PVFAASFLASFFSATFLVAFLPAAFFAGFLVAFLATFFAAFFAAMWWLSSSVDLRYYCPVQAARGYRTRARPPARQAHRDGSVGDNAIGESQSRECKNTCGPERRRCRMGRSLAFAAETVPESTL